MTCRLAYLFTFCFNSFTSARIALKLSNIALFCCRKLSINSFCNASTFIDILPSGDDPLPHPETTKRIKIAYQNKRDFSCRLCLISMMNKGRLWIALRQMNFRHHTSCATTAIAFDRIYPRMNNGIKRLQQVNLFLC